MSSHTVLEYCYRDADNYRAHHQILLAGAFKPSDLEQIRTTLIDRTWFIAEEVGLPPLRSELGRWSGGPTEADHEWHEFVGLRAATDSECNHLVLHSTLTEVIGRFGEAQRTRGVRM